MNSFKNCIKKIVGTIFFQRKTILFESVPDFSDSSIEIYNRLKKENKYKLIWIVHDKKNINRKEFNTVFIENKLKSVFFNLTAAYCFYSHSFLGNISQKQQKRIFLVHGFSLKNSKGKFWPAEWNTEIICLSDFHKELRKITMPKGIDQTIITGFPRNDKMFEQSNNLMRKFNFNENDKLIMWLPTFRHLEYKGITRCDYSDVNTKEFNLLTNETLAAVDSYLNGKNCKLIVKLHPSQDLSFINLTQTFSNILVLTSNEFLSYNENLYSLLGRTDGLIADFSSVYMDYLILDRPIAFDISDMESYKNGLGFLVPNPLDYMPGEKIKNLQQITKFIDDLLEGNDIYKKERNKIAVTIHNYLDGNSTERVLQKVGLIKEK